MQLEDGDMPLTISDETLKKAGLTEREALIEFACRLFDAGRLSVHEAARLVGVERYSFEAELAKRKIPIYRYSEEHLRQDLEALRKLESEQQ
jgi:predicted HTH domain antitoxin